MPKKEKNMTILDALSSNASQESQEWGICWSTDKRRKANDLIGLMMPIGRKDCWENCAKVISFFTDQMLERFVPRMLEWLMDMNWPGAEIIYARLLIMADSMLESHLKDALRWADESCDEIWRDNLEQFIEDKKSRHVCE